MAVFVFDKRGTPLMPCSEKRARALLARGRARVHRLVPFTIRIVDRLLEDSALQPLRVKIDPGSKTTGMALVRETEHTTTVLGLFELIHRGRQISAALRQRAHFRRRRRSANLRYRAPRFSNRTKPAGWLPPSLQHRVDTTVTWVKRLQRLAPIATLSVELVHFDMQRLEHPDIAGIAYQHGTLAGYELRAYLLEKWTRQCAYCDKQDVPLQIEHIMPTPHGGSNRVPNLTLACRPCNQKKGSRDIRDFVKDDTRLQRILAHAKAPLRDAAAVNTTRWALFNVLQADRAAGRNGHRWAHQMEPSTLWHTQNACPGCGLCRCRGGGERLAPPHADHQGHRAWQLSADQADAIRLSAWVPAQEEAGPRFSDR